MPRYGPPTVVRQVPVPEPPAPDAVLQDVAVNLDGSVAFALGSEEATFPFAVEYHYVPEGTLPVPIESPEAIPPLAVHSDQVQISGPGSYVATPGPTPPGEYAVVLFPVFAD